MKHCPALDNPKSVWPRLCPNVGAAYFFAILSFLTTTAHIVQAIIHRKAYSWVLIMGAAWQTGAYAFRIASIKEIDSSGLYSAWFILILLAPLWINAYVYMVLGRMVYNFTASAKIFHLQAWRFGLYFVLLDVVAFLIQAAGASMATGDGIPRSQIMTGLHIYMGGIGFQWFFVLCFCVLAFQARKQIIQDNPPADKAKALRLLYVLYTVLLLISIRIIFRLVEYSSGYDHGIPLQEAYQYVFDSLPMLTALVLFNVVHPGRIMPGKEANLPSRKARKAVGKGNTKGRAAGFPIYGSGDQSSTEMYGQQTAVAGYPKTVPDEAPYTGTVGV